MKEQSIFECPDQEFRQRIVGKINELIIRVTNIERRLHRVDLEVSDIDSKLYQVATDVMMLDDAKFSDDLDD
jgi:hypothetical protein